MIGALGRIAKRFLPSSLCVRALRPSAGTSVLLTFDDGPHPEVTPAVLDRLKQYQARAIFFVVGQRIRFAPELLQRIVAEGHWLGNHSFTHPREMRVSFSQYLADLSKCQDEIAKQTGLPPRFHRPPLGKLSLATLLAPKRLGLTTILWTHSSEDWRLRYSNDPDKAAVATGRQLAREAQPRSILLFHDEQRYTLTVLDVMLPALRERQLGLAPPLDSLVL